MPSKPDPDRQLLLALLVVGEDVTSRFCKDNCRHDWAHRVECRNWQILARETRSRLLAVGITSRPEDAPEAGG